MRQTREFEGRSEEDAVAAASRELGIPKEKLKYDVLSFGSTGIFGLVGTRTARIRVTLPADAPPEPAPKKVDGDSKPQKKARKPRKPKKKDPPKVQKPQRKKDTDLDLPPLSDEDMHPESPLDDSDLAVADSLAADLAASPSSFEEVADYGDSKPSPLEGANEPDETSAPPPQYGDAEAIQSVEPDPDFENVALRAQEVLTTLIGHIIPGCTVARELAENGTAAFQVDGPEAGLLIGRHGQTLESIHYLVEMIANRDQPKRVRLRLDVAGYIARKEEGLRETAAQYAEKVKRTGKPQSFPPMNAHDRRIVHLALKEDRGVRTMSKGNGPFRRLVILPAKGRPKRQKESRQ